MEPLALYAAACASRTALAGFYNRNVRLDTPSGPVIVRIPIPGADNMDLRVWPEHQVLQAIAGHVSPQRVPRLLHVSSDPAFQVYQFADGDLLDLVAPRGVSVPPLVVPEVVALLDELVRVSRDALPASPEGWPDDGDTAAFARRLSDVTETVHGTFRPSHAALFGQLGIPAEPLAPAADGWQHLRSRPFRLVHCDIHRKNMILERDHVVFLDWELALWGDPVYDLAVHLHKMDYQPHEQATMVAAWQHTLPAACTMGWEHDLQIYLTHERVKSAVVDTVRYADLLTAATLTPDQERAYIDRLTIKLNTAGGIWRWPHAISERDVEAALRQHARQAQGPE
jgi:aminoglycoside phosphotransferase (APT) family kinase protein